MLPRAAGDEETREQGGEMDDLLGLGLLLPTTVGHGGASSAQQPPHLVQASSPKLGSFRGVCSFQVPSSTTPPSSSDHQLVAAAGQHDATRASPLMQRAPCFGGSRPMTIVYAGSVRAYDGVTMEQAEKILAVVAKEARRAAGILAAEPQLQLAARSDVALMTMHYWRLAHHHVNDSLKRTASLARFLDKRKQRAESSAAATTMLHRYHPRRDREEWPPAQIMDAAAPAQAATASARTSASLGGMDRQPRASQDHPKRMKACHGEEEAVSTELRI